jgi:hypothetical protein
MSFNQEAPMPTRRVVLQIVLVVPLLSACGGADKEEIYRAREYVRQLCELESGDNGAFDEMTLPEASKPFHPVPAGIMVAVSSRGISIDGRPAVPATELAGETRLLHTLYDALREKRQNDLMLVARNPEHRLEQVVVAFDSSVSAAAVRAVLTSVLHAEYREVLLAFEPGIAPQVPPAPDRVLEDELRRLPDEQLPLHGANKMAELAADCPDLAQLFSAISFVPPEQRCSMLANSLGEVFGSSSCKTDIDKVLTLIHAMTVPRKPRTVHRVALHDDSPGIPAKPSETWAQIAEALFERGDDRLWLELLLPAPAPATAQQPPSER